MVSSLDDKKVNLDFMVFFIFIVGEVMLLDIIFVVS